MGVPSLRGPFSELILAVVRPFVRFAGRERIFVCEFHYCPRCFPLPHGQRTVFRFQAVPVGKVFGKRGKFRFVVSRKIVDARKSDFSDFGVELFVGVFSVGERILRDFDECRRLPGCFKR